MAISSPLQSKVPTGSTQTIKKLQTILLNRTKVRREIFQQQTILQNRRIENERRKQREDELEAPNLVTKPSGAAGLIAGSAKGFFERLVGFLSYLTAGWIVNNLPTWIAMGKEFIARTQQMGKILGNFIVNSTDIFKNFTRLLGAGLTNLMTFDFLDTSGRVSTAFDELNLSVENWGTDFENAIKLITTPLTEGVASGEDAPSTGTQITDEGAYKDSAPYSGTPAPQVMLQGGVTGSVLLLPASAKGADPYVGSTDRFGYSSWRGRHHNGIDIGTSGQRGYYVAFLLDGTATVRPNNGGAGNTVEIKSGGTIYKFFHLAKFSITSGPYKAGTAIGEIGTTGSSTGIHLHYEVHPSGSRGVDPTPYLNLIKIGKSLGKPTPAPASVASSSTSQPQQNLMGTPSSSGGGTVSSQTVFSYIKQKGVPENHALGIVAGIDGESSFQIGVQEKGNSKQGVGLFQYTSSDRKGPFLKTVPDYKNNWKGQVDYAIDKDPNTKIYLSRQFSTPEAAAEWWLVNWERPREDLRDGRRTKYKSFIKSFKPGAAQSGESQIASQSPAPAQIASQSQSQSQISQSSQALTPERTGPTVIVTQNPSSPARQMMYSGGGGSSGGGSPQMSDFALLNNFIKNKLLLDLAYL